MEHAPSQPKNDRNADQDDEKQRDHRQRDTFVGTRLEGTGTPFAIRPDIVVLFVEISVPSARSWLDRQAGAVHLFADCGELEADM